MKVVEKLVYNIERKLKKIYNCLERLEVLKMVWYIMEISPNISQTFGVKLCIALK